MTVLGEALADEFHDGPVAGGAPFNVARSLAALGATALFISRLNMDDANAQLVRQSARRYGLADVGLQRDATRATGRVSVREDLGAGHRFEIHADAAWDHLDLATARACLAGTHSTLLYFGSLAQRHATSRATLRALIKSFTGPRFLDLNLRADVDPRLLAAESLMMADWVKVSDEELVQLGQWFLDTEAEEAGLVATLMARFALQRLVLTCGAGGWRFYGSGGELLGQGRGEPQPALVDTVGAGDAFTAMLLAGLALRRDPLATLALANRYASFICGVRGPLPVDPRSLVPWRAALHALPGPTPDR